LIKYSKFSTALPLYQKKFSHSYKERKCYLFSTLSDSWEKSYDILNEANEKISKNNKNVKEILNKPNLSKEDHKKIKELLNAEAEIRNKALEKVEKIHREKTKNLEQERMDS
jgi:hypothetical protein